MRQGLRRLSTRLILERCARLPWRPVLGTALAAVLCLLGLPSALIAKSDALPSGATQLDDYFIVNCMLPGQVRRFGQMTQVTKLRPARLEAYLCRLRGGQYIEFDRADMATSVAIWTSLAESGDADAQLLLGRLYERGAGAEPDYALAAHWYQLAMAGGSDSARLALASLYERGLGVPKDMDQALLLYRQALGVSEGEELVRRNVDDAERAQQQAALASAQVENERLRDEIRDLESHVGRSRAEERRLRQELEQWKATAPDQSETSRQKQSELEAQLEKTRSELRQLQRDRDKVPVVVDAPVPPPPARRTIAVVPGPELVQSSAAEEIISDLGLGRFFALVVTTESTQLGNGQLDSILSNVLQRQYRFEVTNLRNPTGAQFFAAITDYKSRLGADDNLLVLFAGESRMVTDAKGGKLGYWLSAGSTEDPRTWLPHDQISEHLSRLPARRVMLLTTQDFNNGLPRLPMSATMASVPDRSRIAALLSRHARIVISGGFQIDDLTQLLQSNAQMLDAPALWALLSQKSAGREMPELGMLQPGSDGGQFFLVPSGEAVAQLGTAVDYNISLVSAQPGAQQGLTEISLWHLEPSP